MTNPIKILIADNIEDHAETRAEMLRLENYQVLTAYSPEKAREIMNNEYIHLAILDIRLIDDDDEEDFSGILLAKDPDFSDILKIMLTGFPDYKTVKKVLVARFGEMPPAIDYLAKKDGIEILLDTIENVIKHHILINWNLVVNWSEDVMLSSPGLIGLIDQNVSNEHLEDRVNEIEDLFRKAFYKYEEITFLDRLWYHKHQSRISLMVRATSNTRSEEFLFTCGLKKALVEEKTKYENFAPSFKNAKGTEYSETYKTTHFGCNLYTLSSVNFDQLETLDQLIQTKTDRSIKNYFDNLFVTTLNYWREQNGPKVIESNLQNFYRDLYTALDTLKDSTKIKQQIQAIGQQAVMEGYLKTFHIADRDIMLAFKHRKKEKLRNPFPYILADELLPACDYVANNSPGYLDTDTILVDNESNTWITDFFHAGIFPIWHDFAQMEVLLRFQYLDANNILGMVEFEKKLLLSQFTPYHPPSVDPENKKVVNAISVIRERAFDLVMHNLKSYNTCLLFNVWNQYLSIQETSKKTRGKNAKLLYSILLMSLLCEDFDILDTPTESLPKAIGYPPLIFDGKFFKIGEHILELTDTEERFLKYLYDNQGKICSRPDIMKSVFDENDPSRDQMSGTINTNLNRMREKIEVDSKEPKYLLTHHGKGVRLVAKPE